MWLAATKRPPQQVLSSSHIRCKLLLREVVCVATPAAARACRFLLCFGLCQGLRIHTSLFNARKTVSEYVCSTGGRPASWFVLCSHEVAHEAETSRILFASVSVVMKGNVFAANSLRKKLCIEVCSCAKMVAILLTVKPSNIVQFKECRCLAICMQSLGFTEVDFPWQLHV